MKKKAFIDLKIVKIGPKERHDSRGSLGELHFIAKNVKDGFSNVCLDHETINQRSSPRDPTGGG